MKQFISNIWYTIEDTLICIQTLSSLIKKLNATIFKDNPITYKDLYQWVKLYGFHKVIFDLEEIWDRHNDYDVETL